MAGSRRAFLITLRVACCAGLVVALVLVGLGVLVAVDDLRQNQTDGWGVVVGVLTGFLGAAIGGGAALVLWLTRKHPLSAGLLALLGGTLGPTLFILALEEQGVGSIGPINAFLLGSGFLAAALGAAVVAEDRARARRTVDPSS